MSLVGIPPWTADGVLPPINASRPVSPDRSPYVVSLGDYVRRFGSTPERRVIIDGLLRYRAALHAVGLDIGFQWLDGSFLEHVEQIENRAPNDVDVVTFYRLPVGMSESQFITNAGPLLGNASVKTDYHVDGYWVDLGMEPELLTEQSIYWYSVWSHRRNQLWKGFVQVGLTPAEDATAMAALVGLSSSGGRP
jgi:uncharacterized protein DUF6932